LSITPADEMPTNTTFCSPRTFAPQCFYYCLNSDRSNISAENSDDTFLCCGTDTLSQPEVPRPNPMESPPLPNPVSLREAGGGGANTGNGPKRFLALGGYPICAMLLFAYKFFMITRVMITGGFYSYAAMMLTRWFGPYSDLVSAFRHGTYYFKLVLSVA